MKQYLHYLVYPGLIGYAIYPIPAWIYVFSLLPTAITEMWA